MTRNRTSFVLDTLTLETTGNSVHRLSSDITRGNMGGDVLLGKRRPQRMSRWCTSSLSFGLIVLLPYIHIGIFHLYFWVPDKLPVDRRNCKCDCWDTVYKGSYESQMYTRYKHMYFNATCQTYAIFVITAAILILCYESFKRLCKLILQGQARWSMLILIILDIYPHYYSWWMYFNYINDDYYRQITHQTFFSLTELLSSFVIFSMCSTRTAVNSRKILLIISISLVHIIVGGLDQFFIQLVWGQGEMFQKMRNLGFLVPDVIHVIIPIMALKQHNPFSNWHELFHTSDIRFSAVGISFCVLIGKVIL